MFITIAMIPCVAYYIKLYCSAISVRVTECENKGVSDKLDDESKPTNRVLRSRGVTANMVDSLVSYHQTPIGGKAVQFNCRFHIPVLGDEP